MDSRAFYLALFKNKRIFINGHKPKGFSKGRYIIATNHVSLFDHFVVASAIANRRICNVGTTALLRGGFGWFFKAAGTIFIDKNHLSLKAIRQIEDVLDRGHIVCMYPEGYVSKDNEIKEFKGGVAFMAATCKVDILPVYLIKRKNFWHRRVIVIGEKLKYQDLFKGVMPTKNEIDEVSKLLMNEEIKLESKFKESLS